MFTIFPASTGNSQQLSFDIAVLNIGSSLSIPLNFPSNIVPTRPINNFFNKLITIEKSFQERDSKSLNIVVVGGGTAGVELAFCAQTRYQKLFPNIPRKVTIISNRPRLMHQYHISVSRKIEQLMNDRNIKVMLNKTVHVAENSELCIYSSQQISEDLKSVAKIDCDICFWSTGASPSDLSRNLSAKKDPTNSWLLVDQHFRSVNCPFLFGAGDCITIEGCEIPKAGVYSVREGPVIAANVLKILQNYELYVTECSKLRGSSTLELQKYFPQSDFLTLVNLGNGTALGTKYGFAFEGVSLYYLKDWIDRKFIDSFDTKKLVANS